MFHCRFSGLASDEQNEVLFLLMQTVLMSVYPLLMLVALTFCVCPTKHLMAILEFTLNLENKNLDHLEVVNIRSIQ